MRPDARSVDDQASDVTTNALLVVTALIEVPTGLVLIVVPSWTAELLLGVGLSSPQALVVARIGEPL
jgi:hypothetical protein